MKYRVKIVTPNTGSTRYFPMVKTSWCSEWIFIFRTIDHEMDSGTFEPEALANYDDALVLCKKYDKEQGDHPDIVQYQEVLIDKKL